MTALADSLPSDVRSHYPYNGHTLKVGEGATLHYLDEGEGKPLLMVHGNPTWSFYYRHLVNGLSSEYRCIVPDHVGCGLSDKPADYPYTIRQHVENLKALVEHLDLHDVTLFVHDWGGPIGFLTALANTDRFKRFVVFNTGLFQGPLPPSIGMCRIPGLGQVLVQGLNGFVRVGLVRAIADRGRMKNGVGHGYLAPYDSWAHRKAQMRFIQEIPMKESHHNWDLIAGLDRDAQEQFSDRPMLIIWGEKDFCFTPWFREGMQQRFPNAEVHTFDDAAHWVIEEKHEDILPLVRDFFERNPLA